MLVEPPSACGNAPLVRFGFFMGMFGGVAPSNAVVGLIPLVVAGGHWCGGGGGQSAGEEGVSEANRQRWC